MATAVAPIPDDVSAVRIGIFGSCVTRDLFEDPSLRPRLAQYTARSSVISVVAQPVPLDPDLVKLDSPFQKRCVVDDFGKTFFAELERNRPDWLVVDLIDERFEVLWLGASCVTRSSAFVGAGLDELLPGDATPRLTPEADALLVEALASFAQRVTAVMPADRVIVHRAGWLTRYRDGGIVSDFDERRAHFAVRHNEALDRAYDHLESVLENAHAIALDRDAFAADAQHRWDLEPFHYEPAYNAAALDRLRTLVAA
jgi:hypothetical protein